MFLLEREEGVSCQGWGEFSFDQAEGGWFVRERVVVRASSSIAIAWGNKSIYGYNTLIWIIVSSVNSSF